MPPSGLKTTAQDPIVVPLQLVQDAARLGAPNAHLVVVAGGGRLAAAWRDRHGGDHRRPGRRRGRLDLDHLRPIAGRGRILGQCPVDRMPGETQPEQREHFSATHKYLHREPRAAERRRWAAGRESGWPQASCRRRRASAKRAGPRERLTLHWYRPKRPQGRSGMAPARIARTIGCRVGQAGKPLRPRAGQADAAPTASRGDRKPARQPLAKWQSGLTQRQTAGGNDRLFTVFDGHEVALRAGRCRSAAARNLLRRRFVHLHPVGNPAGQPADGEQHREHLHGNADRAIDDARVEVDVRVELPLDEVRVADGRPSRAAGRCRRSGR